MRRPRRGSLTFEQVRKQWPKILPEFEKLRGLDRRSKTGLVRQFQNLAIKRVHSGTAQGTIDEIRRRVALHNQLHGPRTYELLFPKASALDRTHLVMEKVKGHSIADILHFKTRSAVNFFAGIKRVHNVSEAELEKAYLRAHTNSKLFFCMPDLILVGFKEGRFLFWPTLDLH